MLKEKTFRKKNMQEPPISQLKKQHESNNNGVERVQRQGQRFAQQVSSCLPETLLKGLVWQQGSGLFSRWRERFLVLTKVLLLFPPCSFHSSHCPTLLYIPPLHLFFLHIAHSSQPSTFFPSPSVPDYLMKDCIRCHKKSTTNSSEVITVVLTIICLPELPSTALSSLHSALYWSQRWVGIL